MPFGRLWYDTPDNAIGYAVHSSRSHDVVIRVYDDAGKAAHSSRIIHARQLKLALKRSAH
jgi:hypothetical protein